LPRLVEVGEQAVVVVDEGAYRHIDNDVVSLLTGAVVARAVTATLRFDELAMCVGFEGLEVPGSPKDHRPPVATAAAIRAAARLVLLPIEGDTAVAAAPRTDDEPGFIYELQRD
jgi:hypothetical protein